MNESSSTIRIFSFIDIERFSKRLVGKCNYNRYARNSTSTVKNFAVILDGFRSTRQKPPFFLKVKGGISLALSISALEKPRVVLRGLKADENTGRI